MGHRRNAYVSLTREVHGGVSPNAYVPRITVEVRVFWPPHLDHEEAAIEMLEEAARQAVADIRDERTS
jgi:hypothetical protein